MIYDVIVVGAGPAGSTAAKTLADCGRKVLLVEKMKLPRYKSCSGQLIKKTLDLVDKYYGVPVPESVTCFPPENRGMIFTDDKGKEYRFEQPGLNVWRSSFDKWLTDRAVMSGAELRDQTMAISCTETDGTVTVALRCGDKEYKEQAGYVIICDGAAGMLKSRIMNRNYPHIVTYQTYNEGSIKLDHHYFYAYLQPELSEYDAWFNVKDNQLVLGVSVKDVKNAEMYHARFIDYMKKNFDLRIEKQLKTDKWLMPYVRPGCNVDYGKGRIFFAGETAGFLNPMGEGISAGLESGHCIGKAIANNFDDTEKIYNEYEEETDILHGYMMRQWSFVGKIADTFKEMVL